MAHPFMSTAKKSSASKFKSMTGKKSSGQNHPDEAQDKALFKKMIRQHDRDEGEYRVGGAVSAPNFARGGRTKGSKKGTTINIAVIGDKGGDKGPMPPPPIPMPPPQPPMAPPPGMGGPGGPPPGGLPTGGLPGMQRGGKVKMTAGAETGKGRLQKARAAK